MHANHVDSSRPPHSLLIYFIIIAHKRQEDQLSRLERPHDALSLNIPLSHSRGRFIQPYLSLSRDYSTVQFIIIAHKRQEDQLSRLERPHDALADLSNHTYL